MSSQRLSLSLSLHRADSQLQRTRGRAEEVKDEYLFQEVQAGTLRTPLQALQAVNHRWNRKPRPQPQTFSKLVFLI